MQPTLAQLIEGARAIVTSVADAPGLPAEERRRLRGANRLLGEVRGRLAVEGALLAETAGRLHDELEHLRRATAPWEGLEGLHRELDSALAEEAPADPAHLDAHVDGLAALLARLQEQLRADRPPSEAAVARDLLRRLTTFATEQNDRELAALERATEIGRERR